MGLNFISSACLQIPKLKSLHRKSIKALLNPTTHSRSNTFGGMHLYTTDIPLHMYSQPELTEHLKLKQQAYPTAESHSQELNRTIEKILPKMSLVL